MQTLSANQRKLEFRNTENNKYNKMKEVTSSLNLCYWGSVTSQFLHPTLPKSWQVQRKYAGTTLASTQQPIPGATLSIWIMNMHANNLCCNIWGLSTFPKHEGAPWGVTVKLTHQDNRLNENTEKLPEGDSPCLVLCLINAVRSAVGKTVVWTDETFSSHSHWPLH